MKRVLLATVVLLISVALAIAQCIIPAQTAAVKTTSYTALAGDAGKLLVFNCASACTLTLPSTIQSPIWTVWASSIGAGALSIAPNGLNLNGAAASITVAGGVGEGVMISTDNANYFSSMTNVGFYAVGGGTAQAQTVTLNPPIASLYAGLVVVWKPAAANTASAPTLAVNGLTATTLTKYGTVGLIANDLTTSSVAYAVYDGTQFELLNPQTNGIPDTQAVVATSTTINANTCTLQTAITMSGLANGMTINFTPLTDTHAITGWGSPTSGVLYILRWPTANTVNWYICNNTSSNITTSSALTFNVSVK